MAQLKFFSRIKKRAIKEYRMLVKPKTIKIEGIKIAISDRVSDAVRTSMYKNEYEKSELSAVKAHLAANDIVMEIGTGIGLLSSYCAQRIGSERVFSYEGNPAMEAAIRQTYSLNGVSPNLGMCLIGSKNGSQTFYVGKNFWSSSVIPWNEEAKPIQVPVKSFNEEIKRINPSFLIIDIEGGEYDLLEYADFYNVQKLVIELHPKAIGKDKAAVVKSKLAERGFKLEKNFSKHSEIVEELFFQRK